jgi:hypothetical protein
MGNEDADDQGPEHLVSESGADPGPEPAAVVARSFLDIMKVRDILHD